MPLFKVDAQDSGVILTCADGHQIAVEKDDNAALGRAILEACGRPMPNMSTGPAGSPAQPGSVADGEPISEEAASEFAADAAAALFFGSEDAEGAALGFLEGNGRKITRSAIGIMRKISVNGPGKKKAKPRTPGKKKKPGIHRGQIHRGRLKAASE